MSTPVLSVVAEPKRSVWLAQCQEIRRLRALIQLSAQERHAAETLMWEAQRLQDEPARAQHQAKVLRNAQRISDFSMNLTEQLRSAVHLAMSQAQALNPSLEAVDVYVEGEDFYYAAYIEAFVLKHSTHSLTGPLADELTNYKLQAPILQELFEFVQAGEWYQLLSVSSDRAVIRVSADGVQQRPEIGA